MAQLYHNNLSKLKTDSDGIRVPGITNQASGIILEDPTNTAFGGHVTFYDGASAEHFVNGDVVIGGRNTNNRRKNIVLDRDTDTVRFPGDVQFDSSSGIIFDVSDKVLRFASDLYDLKLVDNSEIRLGTNNDTTIKHTGSRFELYNDTGDVIIRANEDDKDVVLQADNGSGGISQYFRADGSVGEAIMYHLWFTKIATKEGGVTVTGTVNADSATISGPLKVNVVC